MENIISSPLEITWSHDWILYGGCYDYQVITSDSFISAMILHYNSRDINFDYYNKEYAEKLFEYTRRSVLKSFKASKKFDDIPWKGELEDGSCEDWHSGFNYIYVEDLEAFITYLFEHIEYKATFLEGPEFENFCHTLSDVFDDLYYPTGNISTFIKYYEISNRSILKISNDDNGNCLLFRASDHFFVTEIEEDNLYIPFNDEDSLLYNQVYQDLHIVYKVPSLDYDEIYVVIQVKLADEIIYLYAKEKDADRVLKLLYLISNKYSSQDLEDTNTCQRNLIYRLFYLEKFMLFPATDLTEYFCNERSIYIDMV